MSFLVLVQGYALFRGPLVSITEGAAVGLAVGTGVTVGAYVLEHRVAAWSTRRAREREAVESPRGEGKDVPSRSNEKGE